MYPSVMKTLNFKFKDEKKNTIVDFLSKNKHTKLFKWSNYFQTDWVFVEDLIKKGVKWSVNGNIRKEKPGPLGIFGKYFIWEYKRVRNNKIIKLRIIGIDNNYTELERYKTTIPSIVHKYYKKNKLKCIHCGTHKNVLPDHKDDLYIVDAYHIKEHEIGQFFQPLCNACNLLKRGVSTKLKKTGLRQPPPYCITSLGFPKFWKGDETLNKNSDKPLEGTYWYDIKAFREQFSVIRK